MLDLTCRILAEHPACRAAPDRPPPVHTVSELVATAPGQVYSWDIRTAGRAVKGCYYDADAMIDIAEHDAS